MLSLTISPISQPQSNKTGIIIDSTRETFTPISQPPAQQQPRGAPVHQILSIQTPATVQSGSLWRNPCIEGTLAGNYRVGPDYNVDYSPQESHPGEQSQTPHAYDTHHHRGNPMQQHAGHGSLHEQAQSHSHHNMSQHHPAHHHQILMDPAHHLSGHPAARHMGHQPSHYGQASSPHGVVGPPLYPSMTPTQPHSAGTKRSRPDDLDLSVPGMSELEQGDLDMQQSMGAAYAQAAGAAPTHHHHRLPDQGPPSKMMRRDGDGSIGTAGGGAPSVVGQAGMPLPAPRPRGPKLKFTPEDDALLIDLKENKSLTWKQIADFFPGRSSGTLQVRYCTKLKAKTTQWTDETVSFALAEAHKSFRLSGMQTLIQNAIGPKAPNGASRLREREMALRFQQSGPRFHAPGMSRPGYAAPWRRSCRRRCRRSRGSWGRKLIAISVSAGSISSWVWGHHLSATAARLSS